MRIIIKRDLIKKGTTIGLAYIELSDIRILSIHIETKVSSMTQSMELIYPILDEFQFSKDNFDTLVTKLAQNNYVEYCYINEGDLAT